ncbi:hypothetical protein ACFV2Q_07630 [Streptomyces sp. NPDC059650]|uniref:hypothetical protein n=1 Tax=Streptomyces sp. NPDC059650 TaxID=3346896 RepID=UPI0036B08880
MTVTALAETPGALPDAPQLWEVVRDLAGSWLGAGSLTGAVVTTLITAWMWYVGGREGYRAARTAGRGIVAAGRFGIRHVGSLPVNRRVFAALTTLTVLIVQAVWLAACHFFASVLVANLRDVFGGANVGDVPEIVRWGAANGTYTVACVLLMLAAYALALVGGKDYTLLLGLLPAVLPALCAALMLLIAVLGTLVTGLLALFGGAVGWGTAGFFWVAGISLLLYVVLGFAALGAAALAVDAWRAGASPGPGQAPGGSAAPAR